MSLFCSVGDPGYKANCYWFISGQNLGEAIDLLVLFVCLFVCLSFYCRIMQFFYTVYVFRLQMETCDREKRLLIVKESEVQETIQNLQRELGKWYCIDNIETCNATSVIRAPSQKLMLLMECMIPSVKFLRYSKICSRIGNLFS